MLTTMRRLEVVGRVTALLLWTAPGCVAEDAPERDRGSLREEGGQSTSSGSNGDGGFARGDASSHVASEDASSEQSAEAGHQNDPDDEGESLTIDSGDLEGQLISLTYADGLFVAVGIASQAPDGEADESLILSSPDGSHWTERFRGPHGMLVSVAHSEGRWIVVGQSRGAPIDDPVLISDDGAAWSLVSSPSLETPLQIIEAGGGFLMRAASEPLWFSEDGEHWVQRSDPQWVGYLAAWGPGVFWPAGYSVRITTDLGETWSEEPLPEPEERPYASIGIEELWAAGDALEGLGVVVPVHDEDVLYYSIRRDLAGSWQVVDITDDPFIPHAITTAEGVSVSSDGRRIAYRELGANTWTAVPFEEESRVYLQHVAYGNGVFVAAGAWGLRYSEEGKVWQRYESIETHP